MDYYGNVVTSENLGTCSASYPGPELDMPDSGRFTSVVNGVGNFSQFTVIGTCTTAACRLQRLLRPKHAHLTLAYICRRHRELLPAECQLHTNHN